ncbi:hypothetical protein HFN89_01850 [Rhizobium laguerreae]|nr:hypothetical protein [Rhizobium laguerreae]
MSQTANETLEPSPRTQTDLESYVEAAYELSTWAACIKWDGSGNTEEWLDDLREKIEHLQELTAAARTAARGTAKRNVEWRDIGTAPRDKHLIVVSKRFPEPHEAMLYDNGWFTWGANGSYKDDPYLWTDMPERPEGTPTMEALVLASETKRLKDDC